MRPFGKYLRVLGYLRDQWPSLVLVGLLSGVIGIVAAAQPLPLMWLIDYALGDGDLPAYAERWLDAIGAGSERTTLILIAALSSFALYLVGTILEAAITLLWARAGQRAVYALATDLFQQLQRLSLSFHAQRSIGDSLERVTGDSWSVYKLADGAIVAPARHLLVFATIGGVAWQLNPQLTSLLLLTIPPLTFAAARYGHRLRDAARRVRDQSGAIAALVQQSLGAMPIVQAFQAGERNVRVFREAAARIGNARRTSARVSAGFAFVSGLATTAGVAIVVFVGGQAVLADRLSVGALLVFIAYVRSLEAAARGLLVAYGNVRGAEAGVDRVLELLDSGDLVVDAADAVPLPPAPAGWGGEVVFDRVTFGYASEHPILRDLTLHVEPGETLALVGISGAGKTSLASLLPRLFDPTGGTIRLDGLDIRSISLADLRAQVALVLQDALILPLTVADNIAFGRPGASREEIVAAAVAANAHAFIVQLPNGYDTLLCEGSAALSGGERQRIAIARAMLKDARVLVMDEPTASLDAETEQSVLDAVDRLRANRTTILIAHRESTIRRADRIAVLDDGQIVESGTHSALVALGGAYVRIFGRVGPGATGGRDAQGEQR